MILVCAHVSIHDYKCVCVCKYAWKEKRKEKQSEKERVCMCVHGGRHGTDKVENTYQCIHAHYLTLHYTI
jgi:hypothetical protein